MIRINHWSKWQDGGDGRPREAFFYVCWESTRWEEIEPSPELRAALALMEPLGVGVEVGDCKQYNLEDDVFESLGYSHVTTREQHLSSDFERRVLGVHAVRSALGRT